MANIEQKIAIIEQIIGYIYTDKLICLEALQMNMDPMYVSLGGIRHLVRKNKNLETVGDAIIDAVLCKKWYEFRDSHGHRLSVEQFDSQIRQRNACNNFFTAIGRANGIDACILMNAGMGNRASDGMVANTVEAVIGAAYIDAGVNGLAVVNAIMARLGLDNPPLFST
ncbi:hypothetical protein HBH56_121330 [Parastagonospora nodorum]|uniref:Uncharacterized protein n=2 Tax=Phaeosphaeria nodorum (strain SN15 / ATCC MYA-4574 / FGSC 10173) TaxID=321614 RepID=Q0V681_PHANO|nr:hypothetical protein SNOG_00483 [Parastagonospora nodorum SN15]KAH3912077.1 hypothetical protein HBH56_121330 [Parastagonospora nodorum]EAT91978.1 hypothetical protein SNOG_00483 [Parastagonospora nodorum SN15]KAH3935212.1 hypothetical protein HBH54_046880 [Parastagonospora nodorum]KAH4005487.1 hypothetical protein HBI10_030310 [Parastagonospora nodorum]KAH4033297.1 hypothetical protein HBI13_008830 [Parastagonospora nodorum]